MFTSPARRPASASAERRSQRKTGAYGIALGQPQIYDSSPEIVRDRFAEVAKAVPLPMMVYNLSHLSHYGFSPEDMRALCDVAPVEVIKDVPTDFDHIKRTLVEVGDRVPVLYGHKDTLVPRPAPGRRGLRRHRTGDVRPRLSPAVLRRPRDVAARAHGPPLPLWHGVRRPDVVGGPAAGGHQRRP